MFLQSERSINDLLIFASGNMRANGSVNPIYRRAALMYDLINEITIRANATVGTEKFEGIAYKTLDEVDWLTTIVDCEIEAKVNGANPGAKVMVYLGKSDNIDEDLNTDPTNRMKVGWIEGKTTKTGIWKVRITTKVNTT